MTQAASLAKNFTATVFADRGLNVAYDPCYQSPTERDFVALRADVTVSAEARQKLTTLCATAAEVLWKGDSTRCLRTDSFDVGGIECTVSDEGPSQTLDYAFEEVRCYADGSVALVEKGWSLQLLFDRNDSEGTWEHFVRFNLADLREAVN
ncbi:hypothetical protein [Ramlibacter alkalitolerans]|uniref:Uncharacterized protein n=1 Tax=Ramlibacter alkalitolerans TaxID=2039631 RepID=A0ABS1JTX3_9BURK|nr:hypothetical protein [Ramlibacter alkalitolerans]MBL0427704.1 hypothetical protein [Ramlibacter alkalitolerans]